MSEINYGYDVTGLAAKMIDDLKQSLAESKMQNDEFRDWNLFQKGEIASLKANLKEAIQIMRGNGHINYAPNEIYTPQISVKSVQRLEEALKSDAGKEKNDANKL